MGFRGGTDGKRNDTASSKYGERHENMRDG